MPTTKDWTAVSSVPCATRYFADGDAASWCVHTPPAWPRVVTVYNRGTGVLYVAMGPAPTGAAAATNDCVLIPAGSARSFPVSAQGESPTPPTFATWGADGAAHAMDITFERVV